MQLLYQENLILMSEPEGTTLQKPEHSQPTPIETGMTHSKSLSLASNPGDVMQREAEIRKLKHIVSIENQLRKNQRKFQVINHQIVKCEETLKQQRKEGLRQKIVEIEKRKKDRESQKRETDAVLIKLREGHRQRRERMESVVNMYKEEYEQTYLTKISKRRQQMKLDMQEIKVHQFQYLKAVSKGRSTRIKTENYERHEERQLASRRYTDHSHQHSPSVNLYSAKLEKTRELAKRRKEYGQNVERAASSVKITMEMVRKADSSRQRHNYDHNIDIYEHQKHKHKLEKPKLDTNFNGCIEQQQNRELSKIAQDDWPVKEKLARLRNLVDGEKLKYDNGHDASLEKMSNINLLRAQLLLNQA